MRPGPASRQPAPDESRPPVHPGTPPPPLHVLCPRPRVRKSTRLFTHSPSRPPACFPVTRLCTGPALPRLPALIPVLAFCAMPAVRSADSVSDYGGHHSRSVRRDADTTLTYPCSLCPSSHLTPLSLSKHTCLPPNDSAGSQQVNSPGTCVGSPDICLARAPGFQPISTHSGPRGTPA